MTKCPLCGGAILYEGAYLAECDGPTCPNQTRDPAERKTEEELLMEKVRAELAAMGWWMP